MRSNSALRAILAVLAATLAVFFAAGPASADTGHFHSATSAVDSSGALVVSWDERGLGNGDVSYTLSADATAVYACINGGGNHPQASNKETVSGPVTASGTFAADKNGRVVASLTAGPPGPGAFSCPNGQRLVLASVSYTNIVLTDTTNGVSINVADASRIFFNV